MYRGEGGAYPFVTKFFSLEEAEAYIEFVTTLLPRSKALPLHVVVNRQLSTPEMKYASGEDFW